MTGLDKVMKELKTIRKEQVFGAEQTRRNTERIENLERRVNKLEEKATIASV